MPAAKAQDARRGKLVHGLFWGGVSLAPVAILILLFGGGTGSLRIAVTLAVLTIVMLAVSIALRPSIEIIRVDIEHRVLDEMERVRLLTRDDISTAARNTHRALTDQMHVLNATVEDLRSQVDEVATGAMLVPLSPGADQGPGGPGTVRRTETVHVTRRTTTAMAGDGDPASTGTVYGARPAVDGEWRERGDARADARRDEPYRADRPADDRPDDRAVRPREDRPHEDRPHEDLHRKDLHRKDLHRDDRHGDGRHGEDRDRDDRYSEDRHRDDRHRDARAADDRDRDSRRADHRHSDDRSRDDRSRDDRGDRDRDRRYEDSGDRWASVRDDDNGRELRLGERRSSVRSDGRGTEYRVEDRWTALRRDDPPDRGPSGDLEWEPTFRSLSRPGAPRALPPAPGDAPGRYADDRYADDRDRHDAEPIRSRGRERLARESEREYEQSPPKARRVGPTRDGYDRDRGDDRGRADDRGGYDDRYAPRPRSGHPSEYDR